MDRRYFFKALASGLVVATAPNLFLPKLVKPAWKLPALSENVIVQRYTFVDFTRTNIEGTDFQVAVDFTIEQTAEGVALVKTAHVPEALDMNVMEISKRYTYVNEGGRWNRKVETV